MNGPKDGGIFDPLPAALRDIKARVMARYRQGKTRTWSGPPANLQNLPRYGGKLVENTIQGMRAHFMILDDPINEQELDMSKKAVATRKRVAKAEEKMRLVGVRFLTGQNLNQIYTYKVRRAAKVTLGQEVVIRNHYGTVVAVIVQLDMPMPSNYSMGTLKELTHKVAAI